MRFGICCAPHALGDPKRILGVMESAGADYLDWSVGAVMAGAGEVDSLAAALEGTTLRPEAWNAFLPPTQRTTGPGVELDAVLAYATTALERMARLGGRVAVLGSAGARKVPQGFDPHEARRQFCEFCRELGPRAQTLGMVVALEPLNRHEDNLLTSVGEAASVVLEVDHPAVRLLADWYHMCEETEPASAAQAAGPLLAHIHVADTGRVAPGTAHPETDFGGFFRALRQGGYAAGGDGARCSFEGKTTDLAREAAPLLAHLRLRWNQS